MNKPTLSDQLNGSLPIISSTARAGFVASHFILALGSGFAIMYLVIGAAGEHLAPWLSYVVAWAGSLVWYRAIENPLRKFILFAWAYVLTSKAERAELTDNLKRTGRASAWVTAILLLATLSLSLLINVDVAKAVTVEQDSSVEIAQSVAVTGSYNNDVGLLRDQLNEARARDADRTDAAKTQAASWISQAEASKGTAMRNLMRKGNEWASIQLSGAISRARAKGERHVAEVKANSESPTLQGQLTAYIGARSASRDTVATMTAGLVGARRADFTNTLGRRNYMLMIAVFFVLVIFVYSARLLVLACLETGEDLDSQEGDGIFKVAGSMVGKINAKLGRTLQDKFGDKLVLVPVVASPIISARKVSSQHESQHLQPTENSLPSDFQHKKPEPAPVKVSVEPVESQQEVSGPPPPGFANPPKVSAGFWVDEAVAYRKRVYGWWKTAHDKNKTEATRRDNHAKSEDAFVWFNGQGCTVTKKEGGKVSIKFPKS
jgi:hypothetical protein